MGKEDGSTGPVWSFFAYDSIFPQLCKVPMEGAIFSFPTSGPYVAHNALCSPHVEHEKARVRRSSLVAKVGRTGVGFAEIEG